MPSTRPPAAAATSRTTTAAWPASTSSCSARATWASSTILVGSFYDPALEEGCAFEELISFHGGLGGPQTRPFILHPQSLPVGDEPLVGAAAVPELLAGWRRRLQPADQPRAFTRSA
jgi:hypothetical protein